MSTYWIYQGVILLKMAPKGKKVTMSLNDFLNTDKRKINLFSFQVNNLFSQGDWW